MVIASSLYITGVSAGGDGWVCWLLHRDRVSLFPSIASTNIVLKIKHSRPTVYWYTRCLYRGRTITLVFLEIITISFFRKYKISIYKAVTSALYFLYFAKYMCTSVLKLFTKIDGYKIIVLMKYTWAKLDRYYIQYDLHVYCTIRHSVRIRLYN